MFNAAIDPASHCYWNDIMSSHCPPGYHGCEGGVCVCVQCLFAFVAMHACTCVSSKSGLSDGDNTHTERPGHLGWNYQHTCHIHRSSCSSRGPPSHPRSVSWSGSQTVTLDGTFDPLLPLSFPYLPPCWFICVLSLSSHLSTRSISSYSSVRIDTAVRWLSARSTHLLLCVSRLL